MMTELLALSDDLYIGNLDAQFILPLPFLSSCILKSIPD